MTVLITHDGRFHADESMAIAILKLAGYRFDHIVHTRDQKLIAQAGVVVDVGGEYDPDALKFDHHQMTLRRENGVPYASAGLVWKKYGARVVMNHAAHHGIMTDLERPEVKAAVKDIDERIIQPIDAADTGHTNVEPCSLSYIVEAMNPRWDDPTDSVHDARKRAMKLCMDVLYQAVHVVVSEQRANELVRNVSSVRMDKDILLMKYDIPWQKVVVEEMLDVKFVVYQKPDDENDWRVRVVPEVLGENDARMYFPEEWAGLNGQDLAEVTGVDDAKFCHLGRFIAGCATQDGAIQLAKKAVRVMEVLA